MGEAVGQETTWDQKNPWEIKPGKAQRGHKKVSPCPPLGHTNSGTQMTGFSWNFSPGTAHSMHGNHGAMALGLWKGTTPGSQGRPSQQGMGCSPSSPAENPGLELAPARFVPLDRLQ